MTCVEEDNVKLTVVKCDVCGKEKGPKNGWLEAYVHYSKPNSKSDPTHDAPLTPQPVGISLGDVYDSETNTDICSSECLREILNKVVAYLQTGH